MSGEVLRLSPQKIKEICEEMELKDARSVYSTFRSLKQRGLVEVIPIGGKSHRQGLEIRPPSQKMKTPRSAKGKDAGLVSSGASRKKGERVDRARAQLKEALTADIDEMEARFDSLNTEAAMLREQTETQCVAMAQEQAVLREKIEAQRKLLLMLDDSQ